MDNKNPLRQPVLVGKIAYQVLFPGFRHKVRFTARVDKPYVCKETGELHIIHDMEDDKAVDFHLAARAARAQLREHAAQLLQQSIQQRQAIVWTDCLRQAGLVTAEPPGGDSKGHAQ